MMGRRCPSPQKLEREFTLGPSVKMLDHLDGCARCADQWQAREQLISLGEELADIPPTAPRREAVRDAILSHAVALAPQAKRSMRQRLTLPIAAVLTAASMALTAWFFYAGSEPTPMIRPAVPPVESVTHRAVVRGYGPTKYVHQSPQPEEIVRLFAGKINVKVDVLETKERFRIITGDAEVEVRGTEFDLTVEQDELIEVVVSEGSVEVRPEGRATVLLEAGERWHRDIAIPQPEVAIEADRPLPPARPEVRSRRRVRSTDRQPSTTQPAAEPASTPAPPAKRSKWKELPSSREIQREQPIIPPPVARQPTAAELAFGQGWRALRRGDNRQAAGHFRAALSAANGDPLAEDACFWLAVAYGRGGRQSAAKTALQRFLTRYPNSPRINEARAMLGWRLLDDGDLERARRLFERAQRARVPAVRASAQKGLVEIERLSRPLD